MKASSTMTAHKNAFGLLMSLNMLIETPGGFDFTGADCMGWMKEAGFRETRVEHLVGPDSMVIGIKSQECARVARAPSPAAFDVDLESRGRGRPRHTLAPF